jgi:hypothetical protein
MHCIIPTHERHVRTCTYSRTRAAALAFMHIYTRTQEHKNTCMHACEPAYRHAHACADMRAYILAHANKSCTPRMRNTIHTYAQICADAHAHSHHHAPECKCAHIVHACSCASLRLLACARDVSGTHTLVHATECTCPCTCTCSCTHTYAHDIMRAPTCVGKHRWCVHANAHTRNRTRMGKNAHAAHACA